MSKAHTRTRKGLAAALGFAAAVAVATALGSIVQTQFNLAALEGLGVPVPPRVRLTATLHDLGSFTLVYVVLVTVSLAAAFPVALRLARTAPAWRAVLLPAAAACSVLAAFQLIDALSPVPTFIAATRSAAGTFAMMLAAAVGGWVYARLRQTRL